jgi:hypothetical protein
MIFRIIKKRTAKNITRNRKQFKTDSTMKKNEIEKVRRLGIPGIPQNGPNFDELKASL